MKKINLLLFLIPVITLFTSCFKEDERVIPYNPGNVQTTVITMEEDYRLMSFFKLYTGEVVDSSFKYDWDLAISTKANDYTLFPNTSLFMKVAHTGAYNFDSIYTIPNNAEWKFDSSDGDSSGNAIGLWWLDADSALLNAGEVLLIDRGIDFDGLPLGYLKIQPLLNHQSNTVEIKISKIDNTEQRSFSFTRDNSHSLETMSFQDGLNEKQPFPAANDWDLWFTQYTTLLFTDEGDAYPYLVTGALINKDNTSVALDTIHPFNEITRETADASSLSSRYDFIGYDWKKINGDVTSGEITYTARTNYVYIIKTSEGFFYKLRFIDFYNDQGKKGYPKFEFQRL
ncbi:MAG TPA: HmuY family protein [Lentimicrobium sp.]|nr:HmuY family protein [Lentimicrobium sp.]